MYQQNTVWDFPFLYISASEFLVMNVTAHFLQGIWIDCEQTFFPYQNQGEA